MLGKNRAIRTLEEAVFLYVSVLSAYLFVMWKIYEKVWRFVTDGV